MTYSVLTIILWLVGSLGPGSHPSKEDFLAAIASGKVTEVREMLSADQSLASVEATDGTSALLYAVYQRQPQIVAVLLPYRRTQLTIFESAAVGETARIQALLRNDPKLANALSRDGFTPLHLASFFGQVDSVELLISAGANLETHSRNTLNATPLQSALAAHQLRVAEKLLVNHANPNCRGEEGYTPLFEAAASGQAEAAELLLKHGADPSIKGTDGKTAVDVARQAHQSKIEEILSKGAI